MGKCERASIQIWWVKYNRRWHEPLYEMKHNGVTMAPRIIEIEHMELQCTPKRAQGVLVIRGPRRRIRECTKPEEMWKTEWNGYMESSIRLAWQVKVEQHCVCSNKAFCAKMKPKSLATCHQQKGVVNLLWKWWINMNKTNHLDWCKYRCRLSAYIYWDYDDNFTWYNADEIKWHQLE